MTSIKSYLFSNFCYWASNLGGEERPLMLFLFSCLLHISTQGHFHILGIGQFGLLVSTNILSDIDSESQSFDALSSQVCATDQVVMLHSQLPTLSASTASLTNDFKPFPLQHWNAGQAGCKFPCTQVAVSESTGGVVRPSEMFQVPSRTIYPPPANALTSYYPPRPPQEGFHQ